MTTLDSSQRLALYQRMVEIREVETRLGELFKAGEIPGFIHLSIGQEAVAAGIASALQRGDTYATTHRGHGHAIANGIDLERFLREVLGRDGGLCGGRGGSMHVADVSAGMLGANGIVGAGVPLAVGSALAHVVQGRRQVAVAFFGDGALAEGVVHESVNLARLWSLPVLFVCENNGWSEFSPTSRMFAAAPTTWAAGYGLEAASVDGDDAEVVALEASRLVAAIRDGGGPRLLECRTHRHRGHFEGDPQRYRSADELSATRDADPLQRLRSRLSPPDVDRAELELLELEARQRVNAALAVARAAPLPAFPDPRGSTYAGGSHG